MEILQGQYLKAVTSDKGQLKAIDIKTDEGLKRVALPKSLRAIAQQEITLGDQVRVWARARRKPSQKPSKKLSKKQAQKKACWQAVQLVPLSPKLKIVLKTAAVQKKRSQKATASGKRLTVQVCQKKNCCRRGGDALWQTLKVAQEATPEGRQESAASFKLESIGCLGGCKNGPNLRILPANVKYRSVKPAAISKILEKHSG